MSPLVTGACEAPGWVKRSPHKSARRLLEQEPALPGVRDVGRVEPAHGVAAEDQPLAVRKRTRGPVGHVVHGDHGRDPAAQRSRNRGHGQARTPWRRRSTGRTAATASRTSGNIRRGPVWKSSGSSSTTRYWLKLKPPGTRSTGASWRRLGLHGRRTQEDAELTPPMMRERRVLVLD